MQTYIQYIIYKQYIDATTDHITPCSRMRARGKNARDPDNNEGYSVPEKVQSGASKCILESDSRGVGRCFVMGGHQ